MSRNKIRLIGRGAARTTLHFDAVAQTSRAYHRDGWGTPGSGTLRIDASDVIVSGMMIENDYDYLANDALPDGDSRKIGNPQAVALLADIHSDRVSIRKSALIGYQDMLFANGKRVHITDTWSPGTSTSSSELALLQACSTGPGAKARAIGMPASGLAISDQSIA